ncbi:hypothetical protein [Mycolicibacterium tokaiense]|uniref:Uncharacterized protein n=1 Tax=Mycolicibacterium tokaiense TaxID=39695 RepID=A0A378TIR2_9MYCO|nr:hypothetical protein [Mycolicibacterium tokaiense]BBY84856.1 hypothetical protein MTOK_06380 [Mycolicibacterium tokaiense]STZ60639.1 Uncharacterised protein [Mycolicibacterium tokaiense]
MSADYDKGADRRYTTNPRNREANRLCAQLDRERDASDKAAVAREYRIFAAATRDLHAEPVLEPRNRQLRRYMESLAKQHPSQLTPEQRAAIAEDGF